MDIVSLILAKAICGGSEDAKDISYDNSQSAGLISTNVNDALDELSTKLGMKMVTVSELPTTGEENILYIVPKSIPEQGNFSDEYTWNETEQDYDKVGDTLVSPLPPVTSSDNGKLLGVVNGEWDKKLPKDLTIYNINSSSMSALRDKKQEIINAYNSGKILLLDNMFPLVNVDNSSGHLYFTFFQGYWFGTKCFAFRFLDIKNTNSDMPTISNETLYPLPPVTSSDNGKFLGVSSGAWTKVNSPLPSATSSNANNILSVNSIGNYELIKPYVVNFNVGISNGVCSFYDGKRPSDVYAIMYGNGVRGICFLTIYSGADNVKFLSCKFNSSNNLVAYTFYEDSGDLYYEEFVWSLQSSADSSSHTKRKIKELPTVTSSDESKVLTVNSSGEWVAQDLPDGTNISY